MFRLRPILSVILVLVATFLVSCGSGNVSKIPTTYTPEKIEQLQVLIDPIEDAREKMAVLKDLIAEQNWVDTRTFIHGPLGTLRRDMVNLSGSLLQKDQKIAKETAKELFGHFERIDTAAKDRDASIAQTQFREAIKDFDTFLNLLPSNR